MPRFIFNMIDDESFMEQDLSPEFLQEIVDSMNAYNKELEDAGVWVSGEGLGPTSTARTLKYGEEGKPVVTDGPFSESKEQVAGFWIVECKDMDEAVSWAEKIPIKGGSVEVRPIADSAQENIDAYKDAKKG
jgi:hypothetical protein